MNFIFSGWLDLVTLYFLFLGAAASANETGGKFVLSCGQILFNNSTSCNNSEQSDFGQATVPTFGKFGLREPWKSQRR